MTAVAWLDSHAAPRGRRAGRSPATGLYSPVWPGGATFVLQCGNSNVTEM